VKYILILLLLVGCTDVRYQVTCDSGYKTPISMYTQINKGIIIYKNDYNFVYRKMLSGEVCTDKRIMPQ